MAAAAPPLAAHAVSLLAAGKTDEAETLFVQLYARNASAQGPAHPATVASAVNCSRVLRLQHKHREAAEFCAEEIARVENVAGSLAPALAPLLGELAAAQEGLARPDRMLAALQRVVAVREAAGTPAELAKALSQLGVRQARAGALAAAQTNCERALVVAEDSLGVSHEETVTCMYHLALVLQQHGPHTRARARQLLERAAVVMHQCDAEHRHRAAILRALKLERKQDAAHVGGNATEDPARKFALGEGPLPAGWAMLRTAAGRPYFVHREQRRTTWADPRLADPAERLPPHWEKAVDGGGVPYYIDHEHQRTQRHPPADAACGARLARRGSGSSLGSWDSLASTVSSLTHSVSQASLSSLASARAFLLGDRDRPTFADDDPARGLLPRLGQLLMPRRADAAAAEDHA